MLGAREQTLTMHGGDRAGPMVLAKSLSDPHSNVRPPRASDLPQPGPRSMPQLRGRKDMSRPLTRLSRQVRLVPTKAPN